MCPCSSNACVTDFTRVMGTIGEKLAVENGISSGTDSFISGAMAT